MKKITIILFLFISIFSYSQDLIAVQNGGAPTLYEDLSEAINSAVAGDTIYIPGRSYTVNDTLRKPIHLVGVGINANYTQATNKTVISSLGYSRPQIILDDGASNGSITGVSFTNVQYSYSGTSQFYPNIEIIGNVNNYKVERCLVYNGIINRDDSESSGLLIKGNVLGRTELRNNVASYVTNNVFWYTRNRFWDCSIKNNTFLAGSSYNGYPSIYSTNCIVENNIFREGSTNDDNFQNSIFRNNLNGGVNSAINNDGNQGSNNFLDNVDITTIFENYSNSFVIETADLHLISGSTYANAGRDGTDLGIYGGPFPWKEGSIPFNPHIITKQIAPATDSSGNLQITIEVQAQEN